MSKLITKCPSCQHDLEIAVLHCPACGLELRNDFELSAFEKLSREQNQFLMTFLKNRGNLKNLQNELQISYPLAKKKLDELLLALGICGIETEKLVECGGRAMIPLYSGEMREIIAAPNGQEFLCPQLIPYSYKVFDAIIDLLLRSPGFRAKKGNARNFKLGEPGCEASTVAGSILLFMGKKPGESGLDPVFILAAVLEWAGLVTNGRGEIALTESYRRQL